MCIALGCEWFILLQGRHFPLKRRCCGGHWLKRDFWKVITKNNSRALCRSGKTVLSGLTLDCGGRTVAVMPCGLDKIYSKTKRKLAKELLEKSSCLVSEYLAGIRPRKESFVARDRLQVLFSGLVIVVESRQGSGMWNTVEYARKYQKMVVCYIENNTKADDGNGILVRNNKAYALKDNASIDYILGMSQNSYEQMSLPV